MILKGRCWKFGDNIGIDSHIMPLKYTLDRIVDTEILKKHVMEEVITEFYKKVNPGDVIVAGKSFAQGNPHLQGFLGIKALGLGVVCESMNRGTIRIAVYAGVPLLPFCDDITGKVEDGDLLEVNYRTGVVINHTKKSKMEFKPLEPEILEIIELGGTKKFIEKELGKGY